MNRKQLVVLWAMAVILSAASIYHALNYESVFYLVPVPVLLCGAVLLIQFRNPTSRDNSGAGANSKVAIALLVVMNGLLIHQFQAQGDLEGSLSTLESRASGVESELSEVQSSLGELEKSVAMIPFRR